MTETICWGCKRACGGAFACSWFDVNDKRPVDGWTAIATEHNGYSSFCVIECPEYVADRIKKVKRGSEC